MSDYSLSWSIVPNTHLRSRLLGKSLVRPFPSSLPPQTILDCILDEHWRENGILHVLDVIKWKGQDVGDCETPFRYDPSILSGDEGLIGIPIAFGFVILGLLRFRPLPLPYILGKRFKIRPPEHRFPVQTHTASLIPAPLSLCLTTQTQRSPTFSHALSHSPVLLGLLTCLYHELLLRPWLQSPRLTCKLNLRSPCPHRRQHQRQAQYSHLVDGRQHQRWCMYTQTGCCCTLRRQAMSQERVPSQVGCQFHPTKTRHHQCWCERCRTMGRRMV
jgi:hypothetical protein